MQSMGVMITSCAIVASATAAPAATADEPLLTQPLPLLLPALLALLLQQVTTKNHLLENTLQIPNNKEYK